MQSVSLFRLLTAGSLADADLWSSYSTLLGFECIFQSDTEFWDKMQAEWEELARRNWLTENEQGQIPSTVSPHEKVHQTEPCLKAHVFIVFFLSDFKIHLSISGYDALSIFCFRDITSTQTIHIKTGQMRLRRGWGRPERVIYQTLFFSWRQPSCRTLKTQR